MSYKFMVQYCGSPRKMVTIDLWEQNPGKELNVLEARYRPQKADDWLDRRMTVCNVKPPQGQRSKNFRMTTQRG